MRKRILITIIILTLIVLNIKSYRENRLYEKHISEEFYTLTRDISSWILYNQKIIDTKFTSDKVHIGYIAAVKENYANIYNGLNECLQLAIKMDKISQASVKTYFSEINTIYFYMDDLMDRLLLDNGYEAYYNSEFIYTIESYVTFEVNIEDRKKLQSIYALNGVLAESVSKHLDGIKILNNNNGFLINADAFDQKYRKDFYSKSFWLDMMIELSQKTELHIKEVDDL